MNWRYKTSMTMRHWWRRRWFRVALLLLLVLLGPYLISRLTSPWRRVSVQMHADLAAAAPRAGELQLRVVTYNIAHGRGMAASNWDGGTAAERTARLDQIAELLRTQQADVVVLNEVDFDSSWSRSVDQARHLARKAGYKYWVEQRNLDFRVLFWTWRFGNAILSKHPIGSAEVVDLPGYAWWESLLAGKKRAVLIEINVGGQPVRLIGAHLCHRSESVRVRAAARLAELAGSSSQPMIVAGDLNSAPPGFPAFVRDPDGNNAIERLDQSELFQRAPTAPPPALTSLTFPSERPDRVIDWILIPKPWRFLRYEVEASPCSDHRPVCADVTAPRF